MIAVQLLLLGLVIGLTALISYRLRKKAQRGDTGSVERGDPDIVANTRSRNRWALVLGVLGLGVGLVAIFLAMRSTRPSNLDLAVLRENPKFWMDQLEDLAGALDQERVRNDALHEQFGNDPTMSHAIKRANHELDSLKYMSRSLADRLMAIHTLDPQTGARDSLLTEVAGFLSNRITPLRGAFSPRLAQEYNAQAALVGRLRRDTAYLHGVIAQRDVRILGLTNSLQSALARLDQANSALVEERTAHGNEKDSLLTVQGALAHALDTSERRMNSLAKENRDLKAGPLAMRCRFISDLLRDARAINDPPWPIKLNRNKLRFVRMLRENLSELKQGEVCAYSMGELELEFPDYYEAITLH